MFLSVENIKDLLSKKYISKEDFSIDYTIWAENISLAFIVSVLEES